MPQDLESSRLSETYIVVDTPGIDGNEINRIDNFYSFKIISDFLRRKEITRFRMIYFEDPDNPREFVINDIKTFIKDYCFKDITQVDDEKILIQEQFTKLFQLDILHYLVRLRKVTAQLDLQKFVQGKPQLPGVVYWQNDTQSFTQKPEHFEQQRQKLRESLAETA